MFLLTAFVQLLPGIFFLFMICDLKCVQYYLYEVVLNKHKLKHVPSYSVGIEVLLIVVHVRQYDYTNIGIENKFTFVGIWQKKKQMFQQELNSFVN